MSLDTTFAPTAAAPAVSSGIAGLDDILAGGYPSTRIHLIEGAPGTGKTTLALQFLLEGVGRGERALYITLSESKAELLQVAGTHGWSLDGIEIFELIPPEWSLDPKQQQSIVYASDLELGETVQMVMDEVKRVGPARVVFDSLSEIRLLSQGTLRYRQVLALKYYFAMNGCTVLLLDDLTSDMDDYNLHSLSHGVIRLEQLAASYGAERRRLRVFKMRGVQFRGGYHDFVIRRGGLVVFPRLMAPRDSTLPEYAVLSGVEGLDTMLGGGLDRGTSSLILGPSGSGKSSLALQYVMAGLAGGQNAFVISFDETRHVLLKRASGLGMDLTPHLRGGALRVEQVNPAEVSPGELSGMVRGHVEQATTGVVVLDSLSGYQNAMPQEQFMLLQMHELLTYLNKRGIVTILVLAQHGLVGAMQSSVDLTYLSDTVLMLRFFEAAGKIRRAISVLKKRTGRHEESIREYRIDATGVRVGPPLNEFQGIMTGVPTYAGPSGALLESRLNERP